MIAENTSGSSGSGRTGNVAGLLVATLVAALVASCVGEVATILTILGGLLTVLTAL